MIFMQTLLHKGRKHRESLQQDEMTTFLIQKAHYLREVTQQKLIVSVPFDKILFRAPIRLDDSHAHQQSSSVNMKSCKGENIMGWVTETRNRSGKGMNVKILHTSFEVCVVGAS
jgi:hypothetical protein